MLHVPRHDYAMISCSTVTVSCPKRQTSIQNGKSTFLSCLLTNVDKIRNDDWPWEDLLPTNVDEIWRDDGPWEYLDTVIYILVDVF